LSYDNLCENDLGIVVVLIVSEKVKIIKKQEDQSVPFITDRECTQTRESI
jgi:hypothetical protein